MSFSLSNLWILALPMLPNLLFLVLPARGMVAFKATPWLESVEGVSRMGTFLLPLIVKKRYSSSKLPLLIAMLLLMGVYYVGWFRYFLLGREYGLLFAPLFGIPLPLAVCPVLYFLMAAVLLGSWPMFGFAAVFAVSHMQISYLTLQYLGTLSR